MGQFSVYGGSVTIAEVIDEILVSVTPLKRKGTQDMHRIYLSELREEIGAYDLETFRKVQFLKWLNGFKLKKESRSTFNDYSKFMNIISNYAYQNKYISHLIKYPATDAEKDAIGRVYKHNELKALWAFMDDSLRPAFILSLECYMRLREVLHLEWDRVDLVNKKLTLRKQDVKTGSRCGKGRVVPLSPNAFEYLSELKKRATTKWVFPNPQGTGPQNENRRTWKNAKNAAKIRGRARWHDLRHTALSMAVMEKKIPLAELSKVAGVSIRTLEKVYLHAEVEHLREVTQAINIKKIA